MPGESYPSFTSQEIMKLRLLAEEIVRKYAIQKEGYWEVLLLFTFVTQLSSREVKLASIDLQGGLQSRH